MAFKEDSTVGRREQKKLETRRAIRNAALELGTQRGVERLTVESIAHAAGISPRTFFNYFSSKEDALVADATEAASQICALLLERPAEEAPMRALHNAVMDSPYLGSIQPNRERTLARQRLAQHDLSLMKHQLGKVLTGTHVCRCIGNTDGCRGRRRYFPRAFSSDGCQHDTGCCPTLGCQRRATII